jgi:ABA4-like protein
LHLPDSFIKLNKIMELYQNPSPLTASWLHFLALDLFVGSWMVRDGIARGMPVLLIFICLPFTFIFGPAGLLLYILLRFIVGQRGAGDAG